MEDYPKLNQFVDILEFVLVSLDNLASRKRRLERDLQTTMDKMSKVVDLIKANGGVDLLSRDSQERIKDIHYSQLEIIQKLNVMIEVFAYILHVLRTDFTKLPTRMLGRWDIDLKAEIQYMKGLGSDEVKKAFLLPSPDDLPLSAEDRGTLREILAKHIEVVIYQIKFIVRFRESYLEVYNKYKHSYSELTGFIGVNKESGNIDSSLFVRSSELVDKQSGLKKIISYYVASGTDVIPYYSDVAAAVTNVTKILLESVAYFINNGMNSLPRTYLGNPSKADIDRIGDSLPFMRWPSVKGIVTLGPVSPETFEKMRKGILEVFVYKLDRDIMGPEAVSGVEATYTKG